jgi:YHS domain-containing protein
VLLPALQEGTAYSVAKDGQEIFFETEENANALLDDIKSYTLKVGTEKESDDLLPAHLLTMPFADPVDQREYQVLHGVKYVLFRHGQPIFFQTQENLDTFLAAPRTYLQEIRSPRHKEL